jgi:prepilin-type N-terminal cleavage/methylation domain-containing protein
VLIDAVNVFSLARRSSQKGFTLVELLVVISIIGVLATLVLLQLGTARAKSRDAKRISDINQLRSAVEQYFEDNSGRYPEAITSAELGSYMTTIPTDPLTGDPYDYSFTPADDPLSFRLGTTLEGTSNALKSDADINVTGWGEINGDADVTQAEEDACASNTANCYYDQGAN